MWTGCHLLAQPSKNYDLGKLDKAHDFPLGRGQRTARPGAGTRRAGAQLPARGARPGRAMFPQRSEGRAVCLGVCTEDSSAATVGVGRGRGRRGLTQGHLRPRGGAGHAEASGEPPPAFSAPHLIPPSKPSDLILPSPWLCFSRRSGSQRLPRWLSSLSHVHLRVAWPWTRCFILCFTT